MTQTKRVFKDRPALRQMLSSNGILIGFLAIVLLLGIFAKGFFTIGNLVTILKQVSAIGIATIGVGMLIIMNCNDLSIGSMFALCGVTAGLTVSTGTGGLGLPPVLGFAVGIATGVAFGLLNGAIVAKGRIPAFIVTMGTQSIARGLALILAHGMPVGSFPAAFNYLGTSSIDGNGLIPWSVVIFLAIVLGMNFAMRKLPIGRYAYAVGGNEDAARVAGINVDKVKMLIYVIEGALLGLAGTLMASRLKSAAPAMGVGYELDAIAGAIIGGVSFTGGIGTVGGMVLGAMMIGVINNGMDLIGVEAFYKQLVKGSIIIAAVLIDRTRSGRS
ncbi:MAG: ABC transporter permease [Christensenellaceae bacterium]|nr:ABC transporter permease [Christensenellaceae bacterium]